MGIVEARKDHEKKQPDASALRTVPPHPSLVTRSLPLARPSRAFTFGRIPFAASQAAQVPRGEGNPLSRRIGRSKSVAQSSVGPIRGWFGKMGAVVFD